MLQCTDCFYRVNCTQKLEAVGLQEDYLKHTKEELESLVEDGVEIYEDKYACEDRCVGMPKMCPRTGWRCTPDCGDYGEYADCSDY